MFTKWDTCFSWWDFSHFMPAGFITSSLLFLSMCLEAATIRPKSKSLLKRNKAAFILSDSIQNGSDHPMSWTISTRSRWNLLSSLVFFKWVLVFLVLTLGIFLKMINTVHFKSYIDFFCEWIPQQIFFFSTFGYMCVLIIYKWTIAWGI